MCHSPAESKYECTETWFPQTDVEANQGSHLVENIVSASRKKPAQIKKTVETLAYTEKHFTKR